MGWWAGEVDGDYWGDNVADTMDMAVGKVYARLKDNLGKEQAGAELWDTLQPFFNKRLKPTQPPVWMQNIMNRAQAEITQDFEQEWRRPPKRRELLYGLDMSVSSLVGYEGMSAAPWPDARVAGL